MSSTKFDLKITFVGHKSPVNFSETSSHCLEYDFEGIEELTEKCTDDL